MSSSQTSSSSSEPATHPLESMFDVACTVDVLIGESVITVRDCLALRPRSVVALRRPSGADFDLVVHGVRLASGEIVIENDGTAMRIVEVAPPRAKEPQA